MKKYLENFIKEEDGMETIEWLCILAVVAALIGIVTGIGKTLSEKATDAESAITSGIDSIGKK